MHFDDLSQNYIGQTFDWASKKKNSTNYSRIPTSSLIQKSPNGE